MRRIALVLALLVGACGGSSEAVDEGQPTAVGSAAESAVTPVSFTAPALGGGQIDAADYAGRDLVLWFWAPW